MLLFSSIIPISLRVALDMAKLVYKVQMTSDARMPGLQVRGKENQGEEDTKCKGGGEGGGGYKHATTPLPPQLHPAALPSPFPARDILYRNNRLIPPPSLKSLEAFFLLTDKTGILTLEPSNPHPLHRSPIPFNPSPFPSPHPPTPV
jgi:hypothetical protein